MCELQKSKTRTFKKIFSTRKKYAKWPYVTIRRGTLYTTLSFCDKSPQHSQTSRTTLHQSWVNKLAQCKCHLIWRYSTNLQSPWKPDLSWQNMTPVSSRSFNFCWLRQDSLTLLQHELTPNNSTNVLSQRLIHYWHTIQYKCQSQPTQVSRPSQTKNDELLPMTPCSATFPFCQAQDWLTVPTTTPHQSFDFLQFQTRLQNIFVPQLRHIPAKQACLQ